MKAKTARYTTHLLAIFFMMFLSVWLAKQAYAACPHVPVAVCSTGGTQIPLPHFVCCQLLDSKGHAVWKNTWVPNCCKSADKRAIYDMGCRTSSPVYGMGSMVLGSCQFSYSTCRYR